MADKALRKSSGACCVGVAHMLEVQSFVLSNTTLGISAAFTPREREAIDKAERHMVRAARILRTVGNRMEGTR